MRNCAACRKVLAQPENQPMADLQVKRVEAFGRPFPNVSMDCIGPFNVLKYRSTVTRWGLVITCFCCSTVIIEVLFSMDALSFICALRRVISRRGKPESITCDNCSNFIGGDNAMKAMRKEWNSSERCKFYRREDIVFHYIPPKASR